MIEGIQTFMDCPDHEDYCDGCNYPEDYMTLCEVYTKQKKCPRGFVR